MKVKVSVLMQTDTQEKRLKITDEAGGVMEMSLPYHLTITPEIRAEMDRLGLYELEAREGATYAVTRLHPGSTPVWTGDTANGWTFRI